MKKRIISIAAAMALGASLMVTGCGSGSGTSGDNGDVIKIGYIQDMTGDYSAAGLLKYEGAQVAVAQINEQGGINGKKVELVTYDTASDSSKTEEGAKKLYLEDEVNVLMGAYSSPAHEAARTVAEEYDQLFFYNQVYEGGVASSNFFDTSLGEDVQLETLMKYMIDTFGKKVYVLYADYNWGQISAQWVKYYTEKFGGEIVGYEGQPFGTTNYTSTIAAIQKAAPDFIITEIAGSAMNAFYEQKQTAGLDIPMGCSVNLANGEHLTLSAPCLKDMYLTANYAEEIDTEENKEFIKYWKEMFPDNTYIGADAFAEYCGIWLYKLAVEDAGTTDVAEVKKSLEKELVFGSPAGPVYIDAKTHQGVLKQYLIKCDENHKLSVVQEYDPVVPTFLSDMIGVDLTKDSPNKAYTPSDIK